MSNQYQDAFGPQNSDKLIKDAIIKLKDKSIIHSKNKPLITETPP